MRLNAFREDPDIKQSVFAIVACMIATRRARMRKKRLTDKELIHMSPLELGKAVLAIISMRLEFYKVPDQESGEKKTEKKGKGKGKKLTTAHEIYQLLVGEIKVSRREFLYEPSGFWEVDAIIKGYRRRKQADAPTAGRNRLHHLYQCVTQKERHWRACSRCCLRDDDDSDEPIMTKEDSDELQQLMVDLNAQQNPDK